MIDYLQEADNTISLDDIKNLPSMTCKTRFGPKSDHGMATSSAGSMTPRSPLTTPRSNHIDMLLAGRSAINESNDLPQVSHAYNLCYYMYVYVFALVTDHSARKLVVVKLPRLWKS